MNQGIKMLIFIIVVLICFVAFVFIIESNSLQQQDKDQQIRVSGIFNLRVRLSIQRYIIMAKEVLYDMRQFFTTFGCLNS